MRGFFDRLIVNIALGVPPVIIYMISVITQKYRYDMNPIYWPANKLFPLFAIFLLITTIYIQINFFRNAKKGLKIAKAIVLAVYLISVVLFLVDATKAPSTAVSTVTLVLIIALLPLSFVFNVMVKGSRATQLTLAISAVIGVIIKSVVLNDPGIGAIFAVIFVIAIGVPSALAVVLTLLSPLFKSSGSISKSSSHSSNSHSTYTSSTYTNSTTDSYSSDVSSSSYTNSDDINRLRLEIGNSEGRLYDLENRELKSVDKELQKWTDMLNDCERGNWASHGFVNLDQARNELTRNINNTSSKRRNIEEQIVYERRNLTELKERLNQLNNG